ncbi:hypothetical protein CBR_g39529 [Chara braunii]|uniref:SigF-like NTF2-like domain-containing protein n=1 Tax=Chara braunii TaxID=69332 RepID=A0A388LRV5_CHABU|nr:hypothetical protein CBR_g39529 [Chara braunii]|eukprot:GBG85066.1 hypothetical protein CBR_g39529 [Chara braunii]
MENPETDIVEVVKGLVQNQSAEKQAQIVKDYFAPVVSFRDFYTIVTGPREVLSLYQFWAGMNVELWPEVHDVLYNKGDNTMVVRLTQHYRPWFHFYSGCQVEILAVLELANFEEVGPDGVRKEVKRIAVQRNYYLADPYVRSIPVLGSLLEGELIKGITGLAIGAAARGVKAAANLGRRAVHAAAPVSLQMGPERTGLGELN